MLGIKDAMAILGKIENTPKGDELRAFMHELRNDNLELKAKLLEVEAELRDKKRWEKEKALYEKFRTIAGTVVFVNVEEKLSDIFYCPACMEMHQKPIPIQFYDRLHHICPNCKAQYRMINVTYTPPSIGGIAPE